MAAVKFHKVTTLPGTLEANAFYFVQNSTYAESYVTDGSGNARSIGNSAMINALATTVVNNALAGMNAVEIVADITARNALASLNRNLMVLVVDATGDATVASGSALYAFRNSDDAWLKLAEYESMDVTVSWASISGKPTSAPSLIDDAVTNRHTHANKTQLDLIGESGGQMTYNGSVVGGSQWDTNNF